MLKVCASGCGNSLTVSRDAIDEVSGNISWCAVENVSSDRAEEISKDAKQWEGHPRVHLNVVRLRLTDAYFRRNSSTTTVQPQPSVLNRDKC